LRGNIVPASAPGPITLAFVVEEGLGDST
jgi:hypothetical protein